MLSWQFTVALLATVISIFTLTNIARKNHAKGGTKTLSELAVSNNFTHTYFRTVLWVCGSLFALSLYPSLDHFNHSLLVAIGSTLMIGGEMLLAWLPAEGKTMRAHNILSIIMAIGMLMLAYLFVNALSDGYRAVAIGVTILMSALAVLMGMDRKRFLFYELPFIFLSHISIVIALFAIVEP